MLEEPEYPEEDSWDEFFGPTTDLLPTVMGAFDAILESSKEAKQPDRASKFPPPKRTHQANSFAHLSPNVQKILANVPDDQEIKNKKGFGSEEALAPKKFAPKYSSNRSLRSAEATIASKSSESLEIISPNVQKMLSNLPDTELVIPAASLQILDSRSGQKIARNGSFLHSRIAPVGGNRTQRGFCPTSEDNSNTNNHNNNNSAITCDDSDSVVVVVADNNNTTANSPLEYSPRPLGSYLHTSPSGIASRTPVGRKNLGKYLQVPSESSVGTGSTTSSEVSRPVSLTSLGSCSSSGSSGPNQPGSAYLASAESLDSDQEPTGSQGSADSGIADQPTISPEMRVLQEVMDTETVYVSDLREVIQGYLQPWRADPDCPLAEHLSHLFSNVEEIYEFNRSFLNQLRTADCNPTLTANVFLQNNSGFTVYSEYCTNYPRTMDVLGELTRDEKLAPLFREKQLALKHALPLGSYLLKPVQRILKYHLLLQRLSKQCESEHKHAVDLALATMTSVASHINTMKRKHEHAVRVQEIQSQLYGWPGPDLTALGELIAEGTFRVGGARGRRHVFLFDKVLLMAKSKQDGALAYKFHIMCSNLMLVEQVRGEPLSFHVIPFDNPRLQCTLRARSPQHKREWTVQIKRAILENYSAVIPNHAWQLVMQLGQTVPETEENGSMEKWTPLKQHSTPHYLERRSRVRKSRADGRRTASQDRLFVSLGSWRRKSEPSMVPQYSAKTVPKKVAKIKKTKDGGNGGSSSKFYTDLSDSENCDIVDESNESLDIVKREIVDETAAPVAAENGADDNSPSPDGESNNSAKLNNLEQVVSDLLMQNKEFQRIMKKHHRRNGRESEPLMSNVWLKKEVVGGDDLPQKADSLPRNIQLNDQIPCAEDEKKKLANGCELSLEETREHDWIVEEQKETDISSQIDDGEHPEHKIYRKSPIRFSLVQRFRAIISEQHKYVGKLTYKQGSKSMGEKIAHPDYADPQKLFLNNSQNSSQNDLTAIDALEHFSDELTDIGRNLDMTISESEVLSELERRLKSKCHELADTGQSFGPKNATTPETPSQNISENFDRHLLNSSQNSDCYYERLLEKSLSDENESKCERQNSFNNRKEAPHPHLSIASKNKENGFRNSPSMGERRIALKRPTKAPPPVPLKPSRLTNLKIETTDNNDKLNNKLYVDTNSTSKHFHIKNDGDNNCNDETYQNNGNVVGGNNNYAQNNSKSWVKAMVGRFE